MKQTPSGRCCVNINMRLDGCTPVECIRETLAVIRILSEAIELHVELLDDGLETAEPMEKES